MESSSTLVNEITNTSPTQKNSLDEVNVGLSYINCVVQKNSSIAEQTAAASEELLAQAQQLKKMPDSFELVQYEESNLVSVNESKFREDEVRKITRVAKSLKKIN